MVQDEAGAEAAGATDEGEKEGEEDEEDRGYPRLKNNTPLLASTRKSKAPTTKLPHTITRMHAIAVAKKLLLRWTVTHSQLLKVPLYVS